MLLQEAAARRAKKEIEVLQDRLAREERLGDILRRERDSLRSLLSSYDEEVRLRWQSDDGVLYDFGHVCRMKPL